MSNYKSYKYGLVDEDQIKNNNDMGWWVLVPIIIIAVIASSIISLFVKMFLDMEKDEALQKSYFQKCLKQYTHEKDIYECVRVEELKHRYE